MATIDVRRTHALELPEAKKRAEELAKSLVDKLGIRWSWDGDKIRFDAPSGAAKGATGVVHVSTKEVRVEVDLPFLLRAIKGTIEDKINKKLDGLVG